MEEYLLYGPQNEKDLKRQYPDLGEVPEFEKLTVGELLFVWWYSNPTSPLVRDDNFPDKIRAGEAYDRAFKSNPDPDRRKRYLSLDFGDRVTLAIDRMQKYDPTIRVRSKLIVVQILENFEKMVKVEMKDFETISEDGKKEINWTGRNNYVNSAAKISECLPGLIKQVEDGFGVTERKGSGESGTKAIERFHQTLKD